MKVFLDTNVLLDWLLDRQDAFADEATSLIEAAESGTIEAFISSGSVYTLAYVLEKSGLKGARLRTTMQQIFRVLHIVETNNAPYQKACLGNMKDLEDAFQYEVALHRKDLSYFVTGNLKDFAVQNTDLLPVVTPIQMIKFIPD
ncbi:PIN domain-containing protein [Telluribacter sp.]|jgi:predicted nucleic acid-binding protein|uniref:PIN domain-containing protein n=1 Tax=Telluribacter sp. TaxID=1978767 RepID=UPI002E116680|nr:PIN domain-containing protein [Telluribacter sp.]